MGLLILGFVGQGVSALCSDWDTAAVVVAYVCAALLIVGALVALPWVRRERERAIYLAQLRQYGDDGARDQWRTVMRERGPRG